MKLHFKILGTPTPKQSFRYAIRGKGDKQFVSKYQTNEIVKAEKSIGFDVKSQLPPNFIPFDEAIGIRAMFVFPVPASFNKKQRAKIAANEPVYKETKPDYGNLEKLLEDSLQGIVYINDSRIVKAEIVKIYGTIPRIEIEVYPVTFTEVNEGITDTYLRRVTQPRILTTEPNLFSKDEYLTDLKEIK